MNTTLAFQPQRFSEKLEAWVREKIGLPKVNWEARNFYKASLKALKPLRGLPDRKELCTSAYQGWVNKGRPQIEFSTEKFSKEKFLDFQRAASKIEKLKVKSIDYSDRNLAAIKVSALKTISKGITIDKSADQSELASDVATFFHDFVSPQLEKSNMVSSAHLVSFLNGRGYDVQLIKPVFVAIGRDNLSTDLLIGPSPKDLFIGKSLTNYKSSHQVESKSEVFNKFQVDTGNSKKPLNQDKDFDSFGFLNLGN